MTLRRRVISQFLVCDFCGANNSPSAFSCLSCGEYLYSCPEHSSIRSAPEVTIPQEPEELVFYSRGPQGAHGHFCTSSHSDPISSPISLAELQDLYRTVRLQQSSTLFFPLAPPVQSTTSATIEKPTKPIVPHNLKKYFVAFSILAFIVLSFSLLSTHYGKLWSSNQLPWNSSLIVERTIDQMEDNSEQAMFTLMLENGSTLRVPVDANSYATEDQYIWYNSNTGDIRGGEPYAISFALSVLGASVFFIAFVIVSLCFLFWLSNDWAYENYVVDRKSYSSALKAWKSSLKDTPPDRPPI